jgi:hypothetical protein
VTEPSTAVTPANRVRLLGSVTSGRATIEFSGINGEEVYLQVFDIAGNGIGRADAIVLDRSAVTCHQVDLTGKAAGVVGLVETMLKLHKDLPKAKTPQEQESIQRQLAATDRQIDMLVYELYGLTDDEIRIVEGA